MTGGIRDEEGQVRPAQLVPEAAMEEIERLKEVNAELIEAAKRILAWWYGSNLSRIPTATSYYEELGRIIAKAEGKTL